MKKYKLWWLNSSKEWVNLNIVSYNYDKIIEFLKNQTELTLDCSIKPSIFKIAEVDDKYWMRHIPQYLLEKVK